MNAEIVSVGTELLMGQIVDTHAATMGKIFAETGIVCQRRTTVGDNLDRICIVLTEALSRAEIVVTIGGLGPTMDDLTRDAIAKTLDDEMERIPEIEQELRSLFERRKIRWTESILRQADKPKSARIIPNENGTAPGLICQKNGKTIIALPGPKGEFNPMAYGPVKAFLAELSGEVIHSVVLKVVNMGESHVEDLIRPLMESESPTVAPYAHIGEVHLRVTARAPSVQEANKTVEPVVQEIRSILGSNVLPDQAMDLDEAVQTLLIEQKATVSVAESMTGGDLSARLSAPPGASAAFAGGLIVYRADAKRKLAHLDQSLLDQHGPVSEEVALALAHAVRQMTDTTYGIAIVGNAGPTADAGDQPVGSVFIALCGPRGAEVRHQQVRAERADVRRRATQVALVWLRDELLA